MILKKIGLLLLILAVVGVGYQAYPRIAYEFVQLEGANSIFYEAGAEDLAQLAADNLSSSFEKVQQAQFVPFKDPAAIKIFVFNSIDRYARFSLASNKSRGSSTTNEVYLSSKLRNKPDTLPGILTHELSHVHIRQYTGTWKYIKDIPGWFLEGVAVLASAGAGAESVSSQEAMQQLKHHNALIFDDSGRIIGHKTAHDYGMKPHLYYRLASLYVKYIQQVDSRAFEATFRDVLLKSSFHDAWTEHYAKPNDQLWKVFINSAE